MLARRRRGASSSSARRRTRADRAAEARSSVLAGVIGPAARRAAVRRRARRRRPGGWIGLLARAALRRARLARGRRPRRARPRAARAGPGGAPHRLRGRRRAAPRRRSRSSCRRSRSSRSPASSCCCGRPAARGREVRRAEDPSVVPKKLVLAVIDSLKPDMLDQAVAEGDAPALAALLDCGTYIRDCVSTFPRSRPVASAAIATGCGPGEHHIPSMNWFHRGEERYVEYGSSLPATRAFGIVRSLYDTVYNMNLAHLTRAHKTVFEHLDDAGLPDRLHHLPDLSRPHPPRPVRGERLPADRRGGAVPPPGLRRARALLRRPVRLARHRLHLGARHARPARPPHGLRRRLPGRARPVRLPAVLAARQRHATRTRSAPTARCARSRRPTARSSGSCTWRAAPRRSSRSTR